MHTHDILPRMLPSLKVRVSAHPRRGRRLNPTDPSASSHCQYFQCRFSQDADFRITASYMQIVHIYLFENRLDRLQSCVTKVTTAPCGLSAVTDKSTLFSRGGQGEQSQCDGRNGKGPFSPDKSSRAAVLSLSLSLSHTHTHTHSARARARTHARTHTHTHTH